MTQENPSSSSADSGISPHRRRKRYSGKHPRDFEEKYKEHAPQRYPDTVEKVLQSGKTPAGTHRPIMVQEVLTVLTPKPGDTVVDCTLGFGGHATELLNRIRPGGRLIGLDADAIELPKTEARLRGLGFDANVFTAKRTNFAGILKALGEENLPMVDIIFADLGVSSMQIDNPARGFSVKADGPLDMRMNPKGKTAAELLKSSTPEVLANIFRENADEPEAAALGEKLAGEPFLTTKSLGSAIRASLRHRTVDEQDMAIRRVFQALRIAVNNELEVLENLLRQLPSALKPGGRVAILSFHSGEDRRVKKAFAAGLRDGVYQTISSEVMTPSAQERRANPRAVSAKLRWAIRA